MRGHTEAQTQREERGIVVYQRNACDSGKAPWGTRAREGEGEGEGHQPAQGLAPCLAGSATWTP
jgi:hypothetical protein